MYNSKIFDVKKYWCNARTIDNVQNPEKVMIHVKFHVPAINISNNTESRRVLSVSFFKSNYALLGNMNAQKFSFQNLHVLDLKPTTKAC